MRTITLEFKNPNGAILDRVTVNITELCRTIIDAAAKENTHGMQPIEQAAEEYLVRAVGGKPNGPKLALFKPDEG